MEHPVELLEKLSFTKSIILVYTPTKKVFGFDTLMYYITKSEYKGLPIIMCFTNNDIRKYTHSISDACGPCTECTQQITELADDIICCNINIGGQCHHLRFGKHIFNTRICNRSIKIFDMLEHIYLEPDDTAKIYKPVIYSDYTSQDNTVSLKSYDGINTKYHFYLKSSMLDISPCRPFYKASNPYETNIRTKAIVNTYLKYPSIFNLLYHTI